MEILFVSMVPFEYNSSATIQNMGIIKGLNELGCVIDILTLEPNSNYISYDSSMNDIGGLARKIFFIQSNSKYSIVMAKKDISAEEKLKLSQIRKYFHILIAKSRPLLKKAFSVFSVYDAQKINAKGVSKVKIDYARYDIIISSSDPKSSHLIVDRIFRKNKECKSKWIQYWGDPMLIDITRNRSWNNRIVKYYENKMISKAYRIVYVSPLTLMRQKEIYTKYSNKMDYANQVFTSTLQTEELFKTRNYDFLSVGYIGSYRSDIRNILPLYNAAKDSDFVLNVFGDSNLVLEKSENIVINNAVPYSVALEVESKSDILVCICNRRGTQIPGKIYYIAGYNKPIIVVLDGEYINELRIYFEQFERYILCNNTEKSIKEAIEIAKEELRTKKAYKMKRQLTPIYLAKKILNEDL